MAMRCLYWDENQKDKILLRYTKTWDTHRKIYIFDSALSKNTQSWQSLVQKIYKM